MNIKPIAYFRSPLTSKFGIPRQSGVVEDLVGEIVFEKEYSSPDAIRGLEGFDYIWLIWGFSANKHASNGLTVRPPRLGGNERLGVFATRSPFRPNPLGLSCVKIAKHTSRLPPYGGGRGERPFFSSLAPTLWTALLSTISSLISHTPMPIPMPVEGSPTTMTGSLSKS